MRRALSCSRFVAAAVAVAMSLVPARAHADDALHLSVDWGKLGDLLRQGPVALLHGWARSRVEANLPPVPPDAKWLGDAPQMSLVARDWGTSQLLVGQLTLTDQLRVSRSIRMVVTRVRLNHGRLTPFAQLGLGQWRVDTDWLPAYPHDVELAGQAGGGFELALTRRAALAIEVDYTVLYREQHEPQMIAGPRILGTYLAARAVF